MISGAEMINKVGKKKFVEIASRQPSGPRMLDIQRRRAWGRGKEIFRICAHNRITVSGGEVTGDCEICNDDATCGHFTKGRDFEPHFNIGLGCWVESKSEMKRVAKENGMEWIGDDGAKDIPR